MSDPILPGLLTFFSPFIPILVIWLVQSARRLAWRWRNR